MDSEDSHDGSGDAQSSSSSSSSSSPSHRSSSSEKSKASKMDVKSPPKSPPKSPASPKYTGPRSPSPDSQSQSSNRSHSPEKPRSPDNLSGAHSDINSPENSLPASPVGPRSPAEPTSPVNPTSPDGPKSPSDIGSNIDSPENKDQYSPVPNKEGPQSPKSPARSAPMSPEPTSRPPSPDAASKPRKVDSSRSSSSSPSPDRSAFTRSPVKKDWSPKEQWRRHTKAEQKMVPEPRSRSRSESSQSSQSSSYNKQSSNKDPATEEISEGEMESDQEDMDSQSKLQSKEKPEAKDLNISHEDLSDVSDLDSGNEESTKDDKVHSPVVPPEEKQEVKVNGNDAASEHTSPRSDSARNDPPKLDKVPQEKTSNTEDGEEQLDFEAEEGECIEPKPKDQSNGDTETAPHTVDKEETKPGRRTRGSSLEEGEVSDEGERRPEESEPRPVCRFFSRGACTWGISCRFLHPGVTDKGNYSMFEVVRGVPPSGAYPPVGGRDLPPQESAWERGLRTAKEMVRIANKRKEQDMDFEEKKLHLSVGGVVHDPDAELAYAAAAVGASPPRDHHLPLPMAHPHREPDPYRPYGPPPMYRGRGGFMGRPMVDDRERYYERERERVYERERAYERPAPPVYDERAPVTDEMAYHKRRIRPSREVIVQRAEVERREVRGEGRGREGREGREARDGRDGRGDEWADPWMRAEPAARKRRPPSSEDSYSSSSSDSSSRSSRSPSARRKRRASSSSRQRISPTVIVRERRMATARATAMNPPAPRRRAASPAAARQLAVNPPPPANARHKDELDPYGRTKVSSRGRDRKKYSRSSSSGSESTSSSSDSESESHSSSSSGSSGAKRARHARLLNAAARPRMNAKSGLAAAVTIPNKKEAPSDKESAKKRSATSPSGDGPASKKSVSRREELLKQLKAVEDAIARKRSKI